MACYCGPDTINIRDYVLCDGTDETVGLQAFLNNIGNKRAICQSGVVKHTTVTIDPSISFILEGVGYDPNGNTATVFQNIGTGHAITVDDTSQVGSDRFRQFKNMTIFGSMDSGNGLNLIRTHGFKAENMWISTNGGHGIYAYKGFSSSVKNSTIAQNGLDGIQYHLMANAVTLDHVACNSNSRKTGYANIRFKGSANNENLGVTIHGGCDFTGSPGSTVDEAYGLVLQHTWGAAIIGNYAEWAKTNLLYIDGNCRAVTIQGNYFQDGVCVIEDGAKYIEVGYNTLSGMTKTTAFNMLSSQSANKCTYREQHKENGATEYRAP